MIVEHALIEVTAGHEDAFEKAVAMALQTVLPRARGFRGMTVQRCIERKGLYACLLEWEALEDHTVGFREGPLFAEWRALIGAHFLVPPQVLHYEPLPIDVPVS